jgi:glucan biosynthesis protein
MLTNIQFKAMLYNAITGDTALMSAISNRFYWIQNPDKVTFPCMVYSILDTTAEYTFQATRETTETIDIQIDIYIDHKEITTLSTILERLKIVLTPLNFMMQSGQAEISDEVTKKIIKATRWRYINV